MLYVRCKHLHRNLTGAIATRWKIPIVPIGVKLLDAARHTTLLSQVFDVKAFMSVFHPWMSLRQHMIRVQPWTRVTTS